MQISPPSRDLEFRGHLEQFHAEICLSAAEQVHVPTLAERQAEQVGERRLQPLIRERLKGLQLRGHRVQPRTERVPTHRLRHSCNDLYAACRTTNGKAPMLRHLLRYLWQVELLAGADDLSERSGVQAAAAACARSDARRRYRDVAHQPGCDPRDRVWRRLGWECSRCSLWSVRGGLDPAGEVFSSRCSPNTSSISSSRHSRSSSLPPFAAGDHQNPPPRERK